MKKHSKKFHTLEELIYRRSIFNDNKAIVAELNALNDGTFHSINKFSMYSSEEFAEKFTGAIDETTLGSEQDENSIPLLEGTIAPSVDWR